MNIPNAVSLKLSALRKRIIESELQHWRLDRTSEMSLGFLRLLTNIPDCYEAYASVMTIHRPCIFCSTIYVRT